MMKELSDKQQKRLASFVSFYDDLLQNGLDCRFALVLSETTRHRVKLTSLLPEVRVPLAYMASAIAEDAQPEMVPSVIMMALVIGILVGQKYNKPITKGDGDGGIKV